MQPDNLLAKYAFPCCRFGSVEFCFSLHIQTSVDWDYPSYSGYITVNSTYNSNTFFWYFPAQSGDASAPTILWSVGSSPLEAAFIALW